MGMEMNTYFTVAPATSGEEDAPSNGPRMMGGWHQASPDSQDVRSAVVEVMRTRDLAANSVLVICRAETQVVAGLNIKFTASLDGCESGAKYKAQVFRALNGSYRVSQFDTTP